MPVKIVPSPNVLVTGNTFQLLPSPTVPLFQDMVRMGPNPILYETIDPSLAITVTGGEGCPAGTIPDFITSVTLVPGQGASGGTGYGNNIVSLVSIPGIDIPNLKDIPDFLMSRGWVEPRMSYGTIAGFAPTLVLVSPLRGYYGEKYFYDAEYIYASYYANSPDLTGSFYDSIGKGVVPPVNRLTAISLLEGRKFLELNKVPPGIDTITTDLFPPPTIPINLEDLAPITEGDVLTEGSDYLAGFIPEISSWVKWRPSFIEVMKYNYTLIVTHTCPPFVTTFQGFMLVTNNWTPAANRLSYYIDKQIGFLDTPNGDFFIPGVTDVAIPGA